ncbi:MAG: response regulator [Burkholderiales bacterium]
MATAHNPTAPVRVFVVEDSARIRQRLDELIEAAGATNAGHAAEVGPATRAILATRPDIVILDLQLADGTGFDVLRAVHDAAPEIDVYLFTNFAADPYRQLAERLGARGFIDKSREFERVHDVIVQHRAVATH